ncbi:hypothetical protein GQ53DRAFT_640694 [Thozetella sp. PMI_491]|nr:hypothetical protein GQ53DRAFT_640694 [Thozetella sp. PMI_491]
MAASSNPDQPWSREPPYRSTTDDDDFVAKWQGSCHCGKVQYQLGRARPLASKYCHCRTCQLLHAWAAIFHKTDVRFVRGTKNLGWYDSGSRTQAHHLPCKVYCTHCRAPIMDEGRNMALVFPSLVEGIESPEGRKAFRAQCHLFYGHRVVDFHGDGLEKWSALNGESSLMDDDGREMKK